MQRNYKYNQYTLNEIGYTRIVYAALVRGISPLTLFIAVKFIVKLHNAMVCRIISMPCFPILRWWKC